MNRKEREKFDLHTGKIKLTPQEIQKREEQEKQKRDKRKKQILIVLSSIVGAVLLILGITSYFSWQAEVRAEKAFWPPNVNKPTAQEVKEIKQELVVLETTLGTMKIALDPEAAPLTVNNFRRLVKDKFFDGVLFHRVIKDFMIQGGGYDTKGAKDVGYSFKDEINPKALGLDEATIQENTKNSYKYDYSLPSLKMEYGVIAMANAGANSNSSQFFIVTDKTGQSTNHLNGKHTVFGRVVEGMEIAEKIQNVGKDENEKPTTDVIITRAFIENTSQKGG